MTEPALCKFCGGDLFDGGAPDVCVCCEMCLWNGRFARHRMLPMKSCPWLSGRSDMVAVYGDPKHHDDHPPGERGSCPWCSGWAEVERELFEEAWRVAAVRTGRRRGVV